MAKGNKVQLSPQEKAKRDAERKLKKAAKFKELAGKRMGKALASLKQVERLANRNSYVYTPDQAKRVVTALVNTVRGIDAAFSRTAEAPKAAAFDVGD